MGSSSSSELSTAIKSEENKNKRKKLREKVENEIFERVYEKYIEHVAEEEKKKQKSRSRTKRFWRGTWKLRIPQKPFRTDFELICEIGDVDMVEFAIENGADYWTAGYLAAERAGNPQIMHMMRKQNCYITKPGEVIIEPQNEFEDYCF